MISDSTSSAHSQSPPYLISHDKNKKKAVETHTRYQELRVFVFTLLHHVFGCVWTCQSVWPGSVQPADRAHRLPLCDLTGMCTSERADLQKHINHMRRLLSFTTTDAFTKYSSGLVERKSSAPPSASATLQNTCCHLQVLLCLFFFSCM